MIKVGDIVKCISEGDGETYNFPPYKGKLYKVIRNTDNRWYYLECINPNLNATLSRCDNTFYLEHFVKVSTTYLSNQGTEAWF